MHKCQEKGIILSMQCKMISDDCYVAVGSFMTRHYFEWQDGKHSLFYKDRICSLCNYFLLSFIFLNCVRLIFYWYYSYRDKWLAVLLLNKLEKNDRQEVELFIWSMQLLEIMSVEKNSLRLKNSETLNKS